MTKLYTRKWDIVEHMLNDEDLQGYLEAALEEAPNDINYITHVVTKLIRAHNIIELSHKTGITRETIYKILRGGGNPTISTVSKLVNALGLRMSFTPLQQAEIGTIQNPISAQSKQTVHDYCNEQEKTIHNQM